MLNRVQPKAVPESSAPFSQVVLDDQYAFLSGLVAADFPAGIEVLGDAAAETRAIWAAIGSILDELSLTKERIVKVEVHLANLDDFDAMDAAYREFFDGDAYPARTTTESKHLFGGSRVEITCQVRR
ncbi:MAG: RidA family protein [Gammaproteobacteria bacterium]|nr:RidA family protein [Gammaproteobacteria bacterium]MDH3859417.1 RidA family protein [Gammaproteobacteria bacterium]